MLLRFVSWNLNGFAERGQAAFLAVAPWDVCAIQEATTPTALDALATAVGAGSHVSARGFVPEATGEQPRYVSALLARAPWRVDDAASLDAAPSKERVVRARAGCEGAAITVASLALPPASSAAWGPAKKVAQARAIADWLGSVGGPAVIGIDANTPKLDRPDLAQSEFWNVGEEELLGAGRRHALRDVYREVVERDAARLQALVADRPDGPLAVSYRRGHGDRAVDCRYDSILASEQFRVVGAGYEFEGAVAAGSDHGLVAATLELGDGVAKDG